MRKPHLKGLGPHIPPLDQVAQFADAPGYVVFTLPVDKRIRVELGGVAIADSRRALILWETEHLPVRVIDDIDERQDAERPRRSRRPPPLGGVTRRGHTRCSSSAAVNAGAFSM